MQLEFSSSNLQEGAGDIPDFVQGAIEKIGTWHFC